MKKLNLPDFTATDTNSFSFAMTPLDFINGNEDFKDLDCGSRLLYVAMLDRAKLFAENSENFKDRSGRLYIVFMIEEVMNICNCGKNSAIKYVKQLEDIGLIEKKLQGQGKPALIYVKDFAYYDSEEDSPTTESLIELYKNGWVTRHTSAKRNSTDETTEADADDDDDEAIDLPAVLVKAFLTVVGKLRNTDKAKEEKRTDEDGAE